MIDMKGIGIIGSVIIGICLIIVVAILVGQLTFPQVMSGFWKLLAWGINVVISLLQSFAKSFGG
jgi:hypothetical protein